MKSSPHEARSPIVDKLIDEHGHGAIERYFEELVSHVSLLTAEGIDKAVLLAECRSFADFFVGELRSHLRHEEQDIFPRMRVGQYGSREVDALIQEHKVIMVLASDITIMVTRLGPNVDGAELRVLTRSLERMSLLLDMHLEHEERLFATYGV